MYRGISLSRRLARIASVVGLLIVSALPFITDHPVVLAQEGTALLVDDAETANPELVEVALADPLGFGASWRTLQVPPGFTVSVAGSGLGDPRFMDFDNAGNLLVGTERQGIVYRFPFTEGRLGEPEVLISGLQQPASVALFTADDDQYLYVGEMTQVSRFPYDPAGPVGDQEVVVADLPMGGHRTRTVAFGPDGSDLKIFATGMRNPVGLAFQPGTDLLWATVNERDNQGNEIPPDLVTIVTEGANYGWPACLPPDATPQEPGADCSGVTPPTVAIQAHSAPLGLAFLDGAGSPPS